MRHLRSNLWGVKTTHGQHAADDRILIAFGDIATGDNHIAEEQSRIRAVLARIGQFHLRDRDVQPLGLHDGDQSVTGILIFRKVGSGRNDMSEFVDWREGRGRFMDDDLAAMLLDQDS